MGGYLFRGRFHLCLQQPPGQDEGHVHMIIGEWGCGSLRRYGTSHTETKALSDMFHLDRGESAKGTRLGREHHVGLPVVTEEQPR